MKTSSTTTCTAKIAYGKVLSSMMDELEISFVDETRREEARYKRVKIQKPEIIDSQDDRDDFLWLVLNLNDYKNGKDKNPNSGNNYTNLEQYIKQFSAFFKHTTLIEIN
jgi:hypothetical protein